MIRTLDNFVWGWERWQQEAISEGAGDAGAALYQTERALDSIAELRAQVIAQQAQIEGLGVLVGVLAKLLGDTSVVDARMLHHRVDAALEAHEEAKNAARAAAREPAGPLVQCVRCDRQVPVKSTSLTPEGTTCDSCMASGI